MILKHLLIPLYIMMSFSLNATTQVPDAIVIDDHEYSLTTVPLYQYLKETGWTVPKEASISSDNWRGYVAQWKILNNTLRLTDITINVPTKDNPNNLVSIYASLFNDETDNKGTTATWYSGALLIPHGQIKGPVYMGYPTKYERYKVLKVKQGRVLAQLDFTTAEYQDYQKKQFEAFKQTAFYTQAFASLTSEQATMSMDDAVKFMQSHYLNRYLAL